MTSPSNWILIAVSAALFTHALMPLARRLAGAFGLVDHPSWRRNQKAAVPCSGGIAIYVTAAVGAVVLVEWIGAPFSLPGLWSLGIAGLGTIVLGVLDDRFGLHAEKKLLGQIVVVSLPMATGLTLDSIYLPGVGALELGLLSGPVTLFWYLGFINSINLIDGLDGLAGGIVLGVLGATLVAIYPADPVGVAWSLMLVGTVGGFLRNNLSAKRIFLGDAGSMLLGLWLAGWTLGLSTTTPSVPFMAACAMAVPIVDTSTTILRRNRRGISVFRPDAEHLHHRFLRLGSTPRRAVVSLWFLSLGAAAIGATIAGVPGAGILALGAISASAIDLAYLLPREGGPAASDAILYLAGLRSSMQDGHPTRLAEVIEMQPYQRLRRPDLTPEPVAPAPAPPTPVAEPSPLGSAKVGAAGEGSDDVILAITKDPH